ncbi:transposase [bacterium]|nr:transposase [bacterium]
MGKKEKSRLLDKYCAITGQSRNYVIRKIRTGSYVKTMRREKGEEAGEKKRVRKSFYDGNVVNCLIKLWEIFDHPSGQRFVSQIESELPRLIRFGEMMISSKMEKKLLQISSAQIDRKLSDHKEKERLKQKRGRKIHPLLYQKIPVKIASEQDRNEAGNIQIDLVEHCGENASGEYIYTLSTTDLATSWWEGEGILTKGMRKVVRALDRLKDQYPFPWLSFHTDNDSAFLNGHLYQYALQEELIFTRSRPYEKNDNYLVEQKNGRVVRRTVGYGRYDTKRERETLNQLYRLVGLYHNFFQPVMKLKEKKRIGAKVKRTFDQPKTPYLRVLEDQSVSREKKQELTTIYNALNPAALKRDLDRKRDELYQAYKGKKKQPLKIKSLKKTETVSVTFLNDSTKVVSLT